MTSGGHRRIELGPAPSNSSPRSKHICTDLIAQQRRAFLGLLVAHQLDPDHQAQSANVADDAAIVSANSPSRANQMRADLRGVVDQFLFQQLDGGQRRRDGHGISAEGARVRAGRPVHQLGAGDGRAQGQAAGDALGQRDHVRDCAEMLAGEHLAGPSHAALNLVEDQ